MALNVVLLVRCLFCTSLYVLDQCNAMFSMQFLAFYKEEGSREAIITEFLVFVKVLQGQLIFEILKLCIFNPIPIGLFLSNIDWGGGMYSTPPPMILTFLI